MLSLADELRAHRLRYQADQTLQNVAYLHIAAGRLTRFAPIAKQLGSDHWMPIVALAQPAIRRGRDDIARDVFAAADRPGLQRDYLRHECIEPTGAPPLPLRPRVAMRLPRSLHAPRDPTRFDRDAHQPDRHDAVSPRTPR